MISGYLVPTVETVGYWRSVPAGTNKTYSCKKTQYANTLSRQGQDAHNLLKERISTSSMGTWTHTIQSQMDVRYTKDVPEGHMR